jgi:oligopeptide transport system substrate-binding protein
LKIFVVFKAIIFGGNMKLSFVIFSVIAVAVGAYLFLANRYPKDAINKTASRCLRVNFSEGDPTSLHPHRSIDIRGRMVGKSLFEGLTRLNNEGKAELAAADKVDVEPSYMRYTFSIRPHSWTNGQRVTAYDFEKGWKLALHPDTRCGRADLFYIVKNARKAKCNEVPIDEVGIKALDAKTLVVELEHPAPYFLDLITHPIFCPVYDEEKEPNVFNGPFIIGDWKRASTLELVRNPQYWDAENVKLEKIHVSMISDPRTEFHLFEKGEFDVMGDSFNPIPTDLLASASQSARFHTQITSRVYWLYLNTTISPFHSALIRKGLAYAIDRKDLIQYFFADIPCTTILPKTLTLLDETSSIDDGNTEKAIRFFEEGLKELHLTRETFPPITINYCTHGNHKALAEIIQERLRKVLGIQVKIQALEWNVLSSNLNCGQYELATSFRNAMYEDPLYFLDIFKEKNDSYNYSRWENKTYQQLLTLATTTFDMKEREDYLRAAEKFLLDEMPVIPIHTETCKFLVDEKLKGYTINRSGYVDFKPLRWIQ